MTRVIGMTGVANITRVTGMSGITRVFLARSASKMCLTLF